MNVSIYRVWREAVALSLFFNLAMFFLFAVITERGRDRDVEYVPVDVIQLSQTREENQPPVLRPAVEQQPVPLPEAKPEPPKEKELGLDKKGDEAPQSPQTQTVYQPSHKVSRVPNFKTQVKPVYPSSERTAGVEARVVAELYINEYGGVDDVKIVKSGGPLFDEAVLRAVRTSSFNPGYLEGWPVAVKVQIPYVFKLR